MKMNSKASFHGSWHLKSLHLRNLLSRRSKGTLSSSVSTLSRLVVSRSQGPVIRQQVCQCVGSSAFGSHLLDRTHARQNTRRPHAELCFFFSRFWTCDARQHPASLYTFWWRGLSCFPVPGFRLSTINVLSTVLVGRSAYDRVSPSAERKNSLFISPINVELAQNRRSGNLFRVKVQLRACLRALKNPLAIKKKWQNWENWSPTTFYLNSRSFRT